jgi:long-chain fatty acid transport protein
LSIKQRIELMRRLTLIIASLGSLVISNTAFAAAFQLYELGTPIIGTAGVGQAAVAEDASTSYFNPAGMTQLSTSQFMLGTQLLVPYNNFSRNSRNTITGDNGGNAGSLIPGLSAYYVYSYSPKLKFGVSLTSPYGGMLNYDDGWVGRFVVQQMTLITLNVNPSVAYQFNDWFAAGLGLAIEYANLQETTAIPIPSEPLVNGQATIKVDNTALGYNLGVMFTPGQTTKIGIAYRSQITHDLSGNTTFLRISTTPSTSTKMVMPQNIMASLAERVSDKFVLLGELGFANWASMKDTVVNIHGFTAVTTRDWNNTYRVGFGGQYNFTPAFLLQAGASYDSSPTTSSRRLPDLPMDRQIRLGAGIIYSIMKAANIGFSYEYINFGNANINNLSSNGVLAGAYSRNYANTLQASINLTC